MDGMIWIGCAAISQRRGNLAVKGGIDLFGVRSEAEERIRGNAEEFRMLCMRNIVWLEYSWR